MLRRPWTLPINDFSSVLINLYMQSSVEIASSYLSGDAHTVLLHVHNGLRDFYRNRVSCKLKVKWSLQLLRYHIESIWQKEQEKVCSETQQQSVQNMLTHTKNRFYVTHIVRANKC